MKLINRLQFVAGIVFLVAAALAPTPVFAQTALRLAHHHAVGGMVDQTANKFAELVAQKSGGALVVKVFPAAQLGQEPEAYGLVNSGAIDLSITSTGHVGKMYPPIHIVSLPFVFRDWDHAYNAFDGAFGAALTEGIKGQTNTQPLCITFLGFRDMWFRGEPIVDASAMKGKKMRSPEDPIYMRMFELLGARPTPVTWGEVYAAMQTGVAEGLESPAMVGLDMKFNEVMKSVVRTRHMFAIMGIFASKARIGRLSKDQQEILGTAGREAAVWANKTISQPGEEDAYKRMAALGLKVVWPSNPSAWSAAMQPLWQETTSRIAGSDALLKLLVNTK
jgi:tripartite ATP-independent transporter DctP family solute receptor